MRQTAAALARGPSTSRLAPLLVLATLTGCSADPPASPGAAAEAGPQCVDPDARPAAGGETVPVLEAGRELGRVRPAEAPGAGLTVVDLSDGWVPLLFRDPDNLVQLPQPYRPAYVALASEAFPAGPDGDRARRDAYLELYGIFPTFDVLAARLLDEERHRCHAAVDGAPIAALEASPRPGDGDRSPAVERALTALAERLVCERLLRPSPRTPRWRLQEALEAYQRKHAIVSHGVLGPETRRALAEESRELDFRALLRSLRARVVDATGLIEDGSAAGARGTVLSRRIDGEAFHAVGAEGAADGAPDLISPATEAAAVALGWTDPAAAAAFFRARGPAATRRLAVALRLPPLPAYHADHMELRAEIDRGDVWYELPTARGTIANRPTLTLYARTAAGEELALVRWPTTIGGWKKEVGPRGRVGLRYKNSDVGKRVWRDVVASPAWLPPPQTPARALVRRAHGPERWLPDTDLLGPGYASAYGLVMLPHLRPVRAAEGQTLWYDNGIRTHGSVSYQSILGSESHGCHRLFNHAAVQLASFLLRHRQHVRHGLVSRPFVHEFTWRGMRLRHPIPHRGYRFELTPPVEVEVLRGRVRGKIRSVPQWLVSQTRLRPRGAGIATRAAGTAAAEEPALRGAERGAPGQGGADAALQ